MPHTFSFLDLARGLPAPPADIVKLSNEIATLPAFVTGHAVLMGTVAWGTPTWRSDIDILAFDCKSTTTLAADVASVRAAYQNASTHLAPQVDITLIGAEHEELVERENLVSRSVPILEPRKTSEIFHRVRVRLGHHIRALARAKGNPWAAFAARYLTESQDDAAALRDVLREYVGGIAASWREHDWAHEQVLSDAQLLKVGVVDGFAIHYARLILADLDAYPAPDRREEVRSALMRAGTWGPRVSSAVAPVLALGEAYDRLANAIARGETIRRESFDEELALGAAAIDFGTIEELTWAYLATR